MTTRTGEMVTLTVDGRRSVAPAGSYLLPLLREMGIEIPALCDHPDLEPVGACRLCMVEVTHADWGGWSGLMTACLYPVSDGIEVSTRSDRVIRARRGVLSLLAARCPGSEEIQRLARHHGVESPPFRLFSDPDADDCVLCGLCTRVCETYATGAISTVSRGATKRVATFADAAPDECVGCGACALVCPTGHVAQQRARGSYTVWGRTVELPVAVVDPGRCIGCGACEEACPFSVARVTLRKGGARIALIPEEHCRGCGACLGACPTGAITMPPGFPELAAEITDAAERVLVLACSRNNLTGALPEDARLVALPCAGRVSLPLLLWSLCGPAAGVLVLGRHQSTCRFNGAEDPARSRVEHARSLLAAMGFDPDRLRFVEPAPGRDGPRDAVLDFARARPASPFTERAPASLLGAESLDTAAALLRWLLDRAPAPDARGWLDSVGLPAASPGGPRLLLRDLPELLTLDERLISPLHLPEQLAGSLAVLGLLGHPGAGIAVAWGPGAGLETTDEPPAAVNDLLALGARSLPRPARPARIACAPEQCELVRALGHEPVDVGPDPLPRRFSLSPDARREAEERLARAEAAGAEALLVADPAALARWALLTRDGTWRSSRLRPVLPTWLAHGITSPRTEARP